MDGRDYQWTRRQRQVLDLLAAGRTNAEIAHALGVTFDGAKWHVREVMSKLGVGSREEAAEYWRQERAPASRVRRVLQAVAPAAAMRWVATGGVLLVAGAGVTAGAVLMANGDEPTREDPAVPTVTASSTPPGPTPTATPLGRLPGWDGRYVPPSSVLILGEDRTFHLVGENYTDCAGQQGTAALMFPGATEASRGIPGPEGGGYGWIDYRKRYSETPVVFDSTGRFEVDLAIPTRFDERWDGYVAAGVAPEFPGVWRGYAMVFADCLGWPKWTPPLAGLYFVVPAESRTAQTLGFDIPDGNSAVVIPKYVLDSGLRVNPPINWRERLVRLRVFADDALCAEGVVPATGLAADGDYVLTFGDQSSPPECRTQGARLSFYTYGGETPLIDTLTLVPRTVHAVINLSGPNPHWEPSQGLHDPPPLHRDLYR